MIGWEEVLALFGYHGDFVNSWSPRGEPLAFPLTEINRIAREWEPEVSLDDTTRITREDWHVASLSSIIDLMAAERDKEDTPAEKRYATNALPRYANYPIVLLRGRRDIVLDGRRRINAARGKPMMFKVIVLWATGTPK